MEQKIIFATGNSGKMKEVSRILEDLGLAVISMRDAGINMLKARAVAQSAGGHCIVLADDSGLEIDYLNREPGVYSARYLGEQTSYRQKNKNLIERLAGVPDEKRTARFVCAIAAVLPDGRELTTLGVIEGRIGYEEKGSGGFGYDPIFFVPEYGKTTAELTEEEKNAVSHRGRALSAMKKELKKYITVD